MMTTKVKRYLDKKKCILNIIKRFFS